MRGKNGPIEVCVTINNFPRVRVDFNVNTIPRKVFTERLAFNNRMVMGNRYSLGADLACRGFNKIHYGFTLQKGFNVYFVPTFVGSSESTRTALVVMK